MKIAFAYAPELSPGRPLDFNALWDDPRGLTGSETGILVFAKELARRGHAVELFYEAPNGKGPNASNYEGVTLKLYSDLTPHWDSFDVVISWIYPVPFQGKSDKPLRVLSQQCNSFDYAHAGFEDDVDLFLSPSHDHSLHVKNWTPVSYDKWRVLPDGVYVGDYDLGPKVPGRVIHCSSPDRGLHLVLQEWATIKKAVPNAHLRVFYHGLDELIVRASRVPVDSQTDSIDNVEMGCRARFMAKMKDQPGVEIIGSVSRNRLRREMSEAMVLAYPTDTIEFSEGFSMSTLEGCAAGALPIISACDSLGSIYGGHVPMVPAPARRHTAEWRELVIKALTNETWRNVHVTRARAFALEHDWAVLTAKMEDLFFEFLDRKRKQPVISIPTAPRKLDIVLSDFAGGGVPIDPEKYANENQGGGSRIGAMHLTRAMQRLPHYQVRVFSRFQYEANGCFQLEKFDRNEERDILLAYYDTTPLQNCFNTRLRIASHHTYLPPDVWFSSHSDVSVAPSEHAVEHLRQAFNPHGRWYVLPNGCVDPQINRQPIFGRVLYHASPDRGLHLLLKAWPGIRQALPEATLQVVGDVHGASMGATPLFDAYQRTAPGKVIMALRQGLALATAAGGVELLGRVSRDRLRQAFGEAAVFAYPCSTILPSETFSISIMECCLAMLPVVLAPTDALGSIYRGVCHLTPAPAEEHLEEFAETTVNLLKSRPRQLFRGWLGRRFAEKFTFDRMAHELDKIIKKELDQ